ncbi:MAG TPA: FIST N-terminal domain-containing protein [Thermoleophilaceae bacterium]|nr:FIST N-terminal domain-containing protein [Thermoleophilaceae bacterium]
MTNLNDVPHRWFGVGYSADGDAAAAGAAAAEQALHHEDAKLVIVFCSDSYDLPALLAAINERSGGAPLIGCSTAGQIARAGHGDASVVVSALGGDGFTVSTAAAVGASTRLREAGAEVAACAADEADREHRVLLLLSDALGGDQQEVIRGAYSVVGASVPLVGGCAGDEFKMKRTFQFHGDQVLEDAIVGASLASDSPLGIGVRHGWQRVGEPVLVTESGGNRVYTLDDRPALDVYLERLDAPQEAREDEDAFNAFAITHPLGLSRRSSEEGVRMVAGADFGDRSLTMIAEVPQGGLAWFMEGNDQSVLAATDAACAVAREAVGERALAGVIAFDCAARRGVLGDEGIGREIERVASHAGDAPVAGFYSYGEIARTSGVSGFHNQTLVVLAIT